MLGLHLVALVVIRYNITSCLGSVCLLHFIYTVDASETSEPTVQHSCNSCREGTLAKKSVFQEMPHCFEFHLKSELRGKVQKPAATSVGVLGMSTGHMLRLRYRLIPDLSNFPNWPIKSTC